MGTALCLWQCGQSPTVAVPQDGVIYIRGPVAELDFVVAGRSIFDPLAGTFDESATASDRARGVFDFMRHNFHVFPMQANQTVSQYLYGYGAGLCGEQSRVMVVLWNRYNLDARLLALPRHTLASVKVGDDWQLFDAQHHVDYSALAQQPLDMTALQAGTFTPPAVLDPIGYAWSHMLTLLQEDVQTIPVVGLDVPPPSMALANGQALVIRQRQSHEPVTLPSLDIKQAEGRDNLVPLYFAELTQTFQAGQQSRFQMGLPVLAIDAPKDAVFLHPTVQDEQWVFQPLARKAVLHRSEAFSIQMPRAGKVRITYAMAAWAGERLFAADSVVVPEVGTIHPSAITEPKVWFTQSDIPTHIQHGDELNLTLTLHWRDLQKKSPQSFTVHWEQLVSGLPVEADQRLSAQTWVWMPQRDGADGQRSFQIKVTANRNAFQAYRPQGYLSYQARLTGPYIPAGKNHAAWHFQINE